MLKVIDHFMKEYAFLSNFYKRVMPWKGHWFPTSEHIYHFEKIKDNFIAWKTQLMIQSEIDKYNGKLYDECEDSHDVVKEYLLDELTAGKAKRTCTLAKLKKYGLLIEDWFKVNIPIMEEITIVKFTIHNDLGTKLISTGDAELIEGNYWGDDFWGKIKDINGKWVGRNELGKILMRVRKHIWDEKLLDGFK